MSRQLTKSAILVVVVLAIVLHHSQPCHASSRVPRTPSPLETALEQATTNDERLPILLQNDDLIAKRTAAFVLAYRDDCRAVQPITAALLHGDGHREGVSESDRLVFVLGMVRALGFLAKDCDEAWAFIQSASSSEFWRERRAWASEDGDRDEDVIVALVGVSIQAIGFSGRAEVGELHEQMKSSVGPRHLSDLIVSVYLARQLQRLGRAEFIQFYTSSLDVRLAEYEKWTESPQGKEWSAWHARRQGEFDALDEGVGTP